MTEYYFIAAALPPISIGAKPELSFKEVKEMLALNLSPSDLKKIAILLRPIDLYNIRALWLGLPLDDQGNLSSKELEEALLVRDRLPPYLVDFLDRYETAADRLRFFPSLYASLYRETAHLDGFLLKDYEFEREVRLVLTALRAKRKGRDLLRELQFEDPLDPLVVQILAQKDASEYNPPREYEDLKALFVENGSEPQKLNRALLEYRFKKIGEMEENEHFTMDHILGYLARLILVEEWIQLDREKGRATIEELSQYG